MTTHYNFIYDPEQVKEWTRIIKTRSSTHCVFLSARPKYQSQEEKGDLQIQNRHICHRIVTNISSDEFLRTLQEFNVPIGTFVDRGEKILSSDWLVLYCTSNSRDLEKASKKITLELVQATLNNSTEYYSMIESKLISAVMSSKRNSNLITIDIDDKSQYEEVKTYLDELGVNTLVVETRGGYHVIFHTDHVTQGNIAKRFCKLHLIGDIFCPIPGTLQGNFPVKIIHNSL
jgi:hypothetical protein